MGRMGPMGLMRQTQPMRLFFHGSHKSHQSYRSHSLCPSLKHAQFHRVVSTRSFTASSAPSGRSEFAALGNALSKVATSSGDKVPSRVRTTTNCASRCDDTIDRHSTAFASACQISAAVARSSTTLGRTSGSTGAGEINGPHPLIRTRSNIGKFRNTMISVPRRCGEKMDERKGNTDRQHDEDFSSVKRGRMHQACATA